MGIFYRNNGAITVFLSLILVPILILAGIAVDAIRIYGAKAIVSGSAELAMNTGLASYDQVLKDVYGILSISADENELTNNLIKYFENTINSMGLELNEEDSYTKAIIQDIKNMISSPEKLEFNNLIDMETVNFVAKGVDGTQLYYPETVKRQIVEYMKYRGVVSLGSNFLDKANMFKEVPKQQEVIETKVEYENSLSDIDSACKEIYIAITKYNNLKNELNNYSLDNFYTDSTKGTSTYLGLKDINRLLISVYSNNAFIENPSKIIVNASGLSYHDIYSYLNSQIGQNLINSIGKLDDKNSVDETIKYFFNINENSNDIVKITKYYNVLPDKFASYRSELIREFEREERIAREAAKKNNVPFVPSENTALIEAENEYSDLMNELNIQMSTINIYYNDLGNRKDYISNLVENELEKLNSDLNKKYLLIKEIENQANIASEKLNILLKDIIPEVESKNKAWEKKLNSLSEGDVKNSLKMQYDEISKSLDKEEIKKLKDIMNNNKNFYEKYQANLDNAKYLNKLFIKEKLDISVNNLSKSISFNSINYDLALKEADDMFLNNFYAPNSSTLSGLATKIFNESSFYQYLNKVYRGLIDENSNSNIYKEDAEAKKENLFDLVNTTIDTYEKETNNKDAINFVPTGGEIYEDLATTLINVSLEESSKNFDRLSSNENLAANKKIANNQTEAMKNSVGIIEGLGNFTGNLAEGARDYLFVTEYMTEMFSCHTTNIDNSIEKTLSGIEISKDNNYLFGSEMEYILWGQKGENTNKNNLYTTSSIFGLRFVLNTIYAYTDMEIKTFTLAAAISLAGFTGFGVPLVQNILILALAMGESALDISKLLKGQNVVLYKTYTTWVLKPSGISREAISYTLKTATEEALDKMSNKIIELAESTTDENVYKLETAFDEYSESIANDLAISVSNLVLTPIQTELTVWIETNTLTKVESLNDSIDSIYKRLRGEIAKEPESFAKNIKLMVFDLFLEKKLEQLKSEINNALITLNNDVEALKLKVEGYIKNSIADLTNEAKSIIFENGYEKLKDEAKKSFKNLTDDVKQNANEVIDNFVNKVTVGDIATNNTSFRTGITTNLTISYKEYIKIFLFSGMLAGKDNIYISRMCDLIKLNLVCSTSAPMSDFTLKNSYTMLKIDTQASVRTTFMKHKLFTNPWDENKCYINYSTIYGY